MTSSPPTRWTHGSPWKKAAADEPPPAGKSPTHPPQTEAPSTPTSSQPRSPTPHRATAPSHHRPPPGSLPPHPPSSLAIASIPHLLAHGATPTDSTPITTRPPAQEEAVPADRQLRTRLLISPQGRNSTRIRSLRLRLAWSRRILLRSGSRICARITCVIRGRLVARLTGIRLRMVSRLWIAGVRSLRGLDRLIGRGVVVEVEVVGGG